MIENNKEVFYFMDANFASLEKSLGFRDESNDKVLVGSVCYYKPSGDQG